MTDEGILLELLEQPGVADADLLRKPTLPGIVARFPKTAIETAPPQRLKGSRRARFGSRAVVGGAEVHPIALERCAGMREARLGILHAYHE